MTKIFKPDTDGVIYMDFIDADRYAGDIVSWVQDVNTFKPSGTTWRKEAAARFEFTVDIPAAGDYSLEIRAKSTNGATQWMWVDVDGASSAINTSLLGRLDVSTTDLEWSGASINRELDSVTGDYSYAYSQPLSAGNRTLTLYSITSEIEVHRLALVPQGSSANESPFIINTAINGATSITEGTDSKYDDDTYVQWLANESRADHRIFLMEMPYEGGVVRFASEAYLASDNSPYDDGILGEPYIEESMDNSINIGDAEVAVDTSEVNLKQLNFRGQTSRWLHGDRDWTIDNFKILNTSTIEMCKMTGQGKFQFNLIDQSETYDRTFHVGDEEEWGLDGKGTLDLLSDTMGLAYRIVNIDGYVDYVNELPFHRQLQVVISESTTIQDILEYVCVSLNAFYRTSPNDGVLEFVRVDMDHNPLIVFNEDNVVANTLTELESIPAVKTVTVQYGFYTGDDQLDVTVDTGASTGVFDENIVVKSIFGFEEDATTLANILAKRYVTEQTIYELDVLDISNVVAVGDYVTVSLPTLNTNAVVQAVKRTALTTATTIEVLV